MNGIVRLQQAVWPWYGVLLLASAFVLPPEVAYHFTRSGTPDQSIGRWIYLVVTVLLFAGLSGPRWTFRPSGDAGAPAWKAWAALLLMLVHLLITVANRHQPPQLDIESLGVAGAILCGLWLLVALTSRARS